MTSTPFVFLTFLWIDKTPIFINMLHILLNNTTGEMISFIVILNSLGVLQRHYKFEFLPIGKCPHIIVNLIMFSPCLKTHVILDLEEMISHLVIRQDLFVIGINVFNVFHQPTIVLCSVAIEAYIQYQSSLFPRITLNANFFSSHSYIHHLHHLSFIQTYLRQSGVWLSKVMFMKNNQDVISLRKEVVGNHIDLLVVKASSIEVLFEVRNIRSI